MEFSVAKNFLFNLKKLQSNITKKVKHSGIPE